MKLDIQLFADGKVVIDTELNTKNFEKGLDRIQSASQKAGSTVKNIVAGLGITKLISSGLNMISNSIDDAVKRVDTLNNFPKVMSNLGISAKDADKSIKLMSDKLSGLPTTLDQGAMAVQRFTSANGDVRKSTDIFLALNNAILAGGASADIQGTALEQLSQAYAKGKPDMMEWRALQTAMPAQLKQVALAMGYAGGNVAELGEDLRKGNVSMDDFMDTIVKLNKKGVKGFKSFEQQARNSTAGIGTAIKVAKTQVVKGVADMIGGIDKSLKKSGTSISKLIADFGKGFKKQLDKVAVALSKIDFGKLINTIKILIPIVGSLTAGFVAYNTVLKAMSIAGAIKNFASLTAQFLSMIPALSSANVGMVALNTTMSISPIGILLASVTALTVGIYALGKSYESNLTGIHKIAKATDDYRNSIEEADKSRQKYLDKHMNEIKGTEDLYTELQNLVDANGKVKEGYEDRVKVIVGELNKALGTELKLTDGVIQNYGDMKKSIDNLIASKRAKVLLDAQEEKYNRAKDAQAKLEKQYAEAQKEYNNSLRERGKILEEIQSTYGLTNKQLQEVATTLGYTDENGQRVNLNFEKLGQQLAVVNGSLATNKNVLDNAGQAYADNQAIIGNYEQAMKDLANNNYEAVLKMYEDTTNYNAKTNQDTLNKYQGAIDSQKAYLEHLKANRDKYNKDVYDREVKAVESRIKKLEEEQQAHNKTVKDGQVAVLGTWNKSLSDQMSAIDSKKWEFKKLANGTIQAYRDGQVEGAPMTKKEAKKMADDMKKELSKAKDGSRQAGRDFTSGTTQGIRSGQGETFNTVRSYGNSILAAFRASLKEKSPSKATREMGMFFDEGFDEGVDKGEKASIKNIKDYGEKIIDEFEKISYDKTIDNLYKKMQDAVELEQEKLQSNVEVSNANKSLSNMLTANASFEGTIPVEVDLDGEVIWQNQQKISQTKNLQYGGIR